VPRGQDPLELDIQIQNLGQLLRDLKAFEPRLATSLRREIRNAAKVAVQDARAEVLKPPPPRSLSVASRSSRSAGTRKAIARGIRVQIVTGKRTNGVRIVSTGAGLSADRKPMVKAYNTKSFRHRVFGGDTWVTQRGRPYFGAVIASHQREVQGAVVRAVDQASQVIQSHY
jgi:hypothetical protein